MKNIVFLKTKIITLVLALMSLILALTVNSGFYALFFIAFATFFLAFIVPMVNSANMIRLKHLQDASGGDVFTDQN